jgi:hypothetical protein
MCKPTAAVEFTMQAAAADGLGPCTSRWTTDDGACSTHSPSAKQPCFVRCSLSHLLCGKAPTTILLALESRSSAVMPRSAQKKGLMIGTLGATHDPCHFVDDTPAMTCRADEVSATETLPGIASVIGRRSTKGVAPVVSFRCTPRRPTICTGLSYGDISAAITRSALAMGGMVDHGQDGYFDI